MNKTVYVKDSILWADAQEKAAADGESLSSLLDRLLRNYMTPSDADAKLERIRAILDE